MAVIRKGRDKYLSRPRRRPRCWKGIKCVTDGPNSILPKSPPNDKIRLKKWNRHSIFVGWRETFLGVISRRAGSITFPALTLLFLVENIDQRQSRSETFANSCFRWTTFIFTSRFSFLENPFFLFSLGISFWTHDPMAFAGLSRYPRRRRPPFNALLFSFYVRSWSVTIRMSATQIRPVYR